MRDLDSALARYEQLFAPHIWYRGYEAQVNNRSAALMAVSDFIIEPMQPHPPADQGARATSHFRFLERFGDAIHSLAVYTDDLDAVRSGLEALGVRVTDGGMAGVAFTHPKDFPGLIEFYDPPGPSMLDQNPRRHDTWSSRYWSEVHALGIEYASHVTLAVHDHAAATDAYVRAFGVDALPDQASRVPSCASSFVAFGPDTMLEMAQPTGADALIRSCLERIGQTWWGMTFKVRSVAAVQEFLDRDDIQAPHSVEDHTVRIDPAWMFGVEYAFTELPLEGDPRAS